MALNRSQPKAIIQNNVDHTKSPINNPYPMCYNLA